MDTVYKNFATNDIVYRQAVDLDELFYPTKAITKPYDATNDLEIEVSQTSSAYPAYYAKVEFIEKNGTDVGYFSVARAESGSYDESSGNQMTYHYIKNLVRAGESEFQIINSASMEAIDTFDVIAVNREWYKDGLDLDYFMVMINTGSSSATSSVESFDLAGGIKGLVPSATSNNSNMGAFRYLYATKDSYNATLYNPVTDELTMPSSSDLDMSNPLGEVYASAGLVILYTNRIKEFYDDVSIDEPLHYIAGIGGRSRIQLNSQTLYARLFNHEYNHSTNRTFYEESDANVIKEEFRNNPRTFVTSIGYYNKDGELIAVGKLSVPFEKTRQNELTIAGILAL